MQSYFGRLSKRSRRELRDCNSFFLGAYKKGSTICAGCQCTVYCQRGRETGRGRVGESGTMKLFVAFLIATLAAIASASCASSSYGAAAGAGAAAYGAGGVSSPPCPNNYLFSCSPKLVPVPCSATSSAYGSAGAYSEPLPSYAYFADNFPAQYYL